MIAVIVLKKVEAVVSSVILGDRLMLHVFCLNDMKSVGIIILDMMTDWDWRRMMWK